MRGRKRRDAQDGGAAIRVLAFAAATFALLEPAAAQTPEPTVQELQKQIRQRDALIDNLARRVANLEKQVNKRAPTPAGVRPAISHAVATSSGEQLPPSPPVVQPVSFAPAQTAQAEPQAGPPAAAPPTGRPPAPGQFEVNPEAAERALERTLVATGNLVVPTGFAEIEPFFSYTRRETSTQVLFNVNRNELVPTLAARIGLPWESQLQVLLPWNFEEQQLIDVAVAPPQLASDSLGKYRRRSHNRRRQNADT